MELSRRAFTGLALAAGGGTALTACSTDLPGEVTVPSSGATTGTAATTPPPPDPDRDDELVASALADELALARLLRTTRRRHPSLAEAASAALLTHEAHIELLSAASPRPSSGQMPRIDVPRRAPAARTNLANAEGGLVRAHSDRAVAAASGPLARVLAGMAASAAQQQRLLLPGTAR